MDKTYVDVVRLLLEIIPDVFQSSCFAMKGGTALNLFVRNMPRLSVDVDVTYIWHETGREQALAEIASELDLIRQRLRHRGIDAETVGSKSGDETKILARRDRAQVKIEANHVFRGTILPTKPRTLSPATSEKFTTEFSAPTLAVAELYGSKLVAALDRQHPRDLFDVLGMYDEIGLSAEVIECFVCYLAGHNRPIHEVLFSRDKNFESAFENEFSGMTETPVSLRALIEVRERLRCELIGALTTNQKRFLLSLASGIPEWGLMQCRHLADMPAIRWKVMNLQKLQATNPSKFRQQVVELKKRFEG